MSVDHRFDGVDILVGATSRTVADADQTEHAEASCNRAPLLDDAHKEIAIEQRSDCALRLDHRQEYFVTADPELLSGETLPLRLRPDD
jgi:hypothetical protein